MRFLSGFLEQVRLSIIGVLGVFSLLFGFSFLRLLIIDLCLVLFVIVLIIFAILFISSGLTLFDLSGSRFFFGLLRFVIFLFFLSIDLGSNLELLRAVLLCVLTIILERCGLFDCLSGGLLLFLLGSDFGLSSLLLLESLLLFSFLLSGFLFGLVVLSLLFLLVFLLSDLLVLLIDPCGGVLPGEVIILLISAKDGVDPLEDLGLIKLELDAFATNLESIDETLQLEAEVFLHFGDEVLLFLCKLIFIISRSPVVVATTIVTSAPVIRVVATIIAAATPIVTAIVVAPRSVATTASLLAISDREFGLAILIVATSAPRLVVSSIASIIIVGASGLVVPIRSFVANLGVSLLNISLSFICV